MKPILPLERASVFVDGTVGEPRLNHPEGVAVDRAGDVWCGGETGELYRIAADGSRFEVVVSTGGFVLGLAFDARGRLFACDLAHKAVFRFDPGLPDVSNIHNLANQPRVWDCENFSNRAASPTEATLVRVFGAMPSTDTLALAGGAILLLIVGFGAGALFRRRR